MPGTEGTERRFVRALLRAGSASRMPTGTYAVAAEALKAELSGAGVAKLAGFGVLCLAGETCRPTASASAWLRRARPVAASGARGVTPLETTWHSAAPSGDAGPLARLVPTIGAGFLEPHHLVAGERVCRWGERAQLRQRVTMSYDPAQIGGRRRSGEAGEIADMAVEARKSIARLYAELPRDCAETIVDVCVFEKGLQAIESERGWPRRSAKLVLRIGLDHLAARLGLMPAATGRASGKISAWLGERFEPTRFE